jgi:Low molecular weight phosphotyrosine protein phosphatase
MPFLSGNSVTTVGRRDLLSAGIMLAAGLAAPSAQAKKRKRATILFICQYGTAKSAIAREVLRQYARLRGVDARAFSRGLTLEDHISPELHIKLQADQIDPMADLPQKLSRMDWTKADIVVAFNPLPATIRHPDVRDWSDLPSVNENYADARMVLDKRIDSLLDEIQKR